ncbi:hypothetical protein EPUS_05178 [Endocarpon pusillum Z07020]|uniref:Uncharacterized protein n=1 Tax=Endocarpon pusillum (strain Z07020 / HMAS-L-300199) TaxID=1263415 RepID=U1HW52_ENDPU|nr:uncharacterized protein EPUS_05178 [Endocarpon pusillum Z07020]ERF74970.1 hypothetical protein EPUS_05178 [Endocarpon pusillum Z07020]
MAEIALVAGLSAACGAAGTAAGVGIAAKLLKGDPVDTTLILQFLDGGFSEDETKNFQSRLQNDSRFRQIALALQNDFEEQSRTPDGAQTAGPKAKRLEMALRHKPVRSAQGVAGKQGAASERQLKDEQGRGTQKTPALVASQERRGTQKPQGLMAHQERRGPQGQSSNARGQTLRLRRHGKVE